MQITIYPTYAHADEKELGGKTAIVIDVLRATSTITSALENGCRRILPVEKKETAFQKAKALSKTEEVLLGGERDGVKIPGFDYGNSPLEYGREAVAGRTLVMCTTNGTHAIKKAAAARAVYLGCLNNAGAVAEKAVASGRDIAIICAGTRLAFSVDDIAAAGAIVSRVLKGSKAGLDDLGRTACWLYENSKNNLRALIADSRPYRTLVALCAQKDIEYCLREDIFRKVPVFADGEIR